MDLPLISINVRAVPAGHYSDGLQPVSKRDCGTGAFIPAKRPAQLQFPIPHHRQHGSISSSLDVVMSVSTAWRLSLASERSTRTGPLTRATRDTRSLQPIARRRQRSFGSPGLPPEPLGTAARKKAAGSHLGCPPLLIMVTNLVTNRGPIQCFLLCGSQTALARPNKSLALAKLLTTDAPTSCT